MKRIYVGTLLCIILSLGLLTGCDQGVARSLGGDMTLELEPGKTGDDYLEGGFLVVFDQTHAG